MFHRRLSEEADEESLINVAVAVIFAREFLEAFVILGNYRMAIQRSEWEEEKKKQAFKIVNWSAGIASFLALLVIIALAVPLSVLGKDLPQTTIEVIEGVSKVVAAICIIQLSVKIPVWLQLYWRVSILPWKQKEVKKPEGTDIDFNEMKFNVAWNIWREVAEIGVFLIPFFMGKSALKAVPLSALLGTAIAVGLGGIVFYANKKLTNKFWLAFLMSGLALFLAVGLFTGGCHYFEEAWGLTPTVWKIEDEGWNEKRFPMAIAKVFGYSSERTVLQICCFWGSLFVGLGYHYLKWRATQKAKARFANDDPLDASMDIESESSRTNSGTNSGVDREEVATA